MKNDLLMTCYECHRHLHQLLDMPNLGFKNVAYMCMETVEAQDRSADDSPVTRDRKSFKDIAIRESPSDFTSIVALAEEDL